MRLFTIILIVLLMQNCHKTEIPDFEGQFDVSVMSFNLRYDNEEDENNRWDLRKQSIINMLTEKKPNILGIQEGLQHQVEFLSDHLQNYHFKGVGRDDGIQAGEYSAIFYDTEKYEAIEDGNFWLSETPDNPSLGWDANNIRIVTWVKLIDHQTNDSLYVFNTHFDHRGKQAKENSSILIIQKIKDITDELTPVFLTGDFNMKIKNCRLAPIKEVFSSAKDTAPESDKYSSFNAFGRTIPKGNIDFIFYKNAVPKHYKTVVKDYGVPYISDHYPILGYFDF